MLNLGRWTDRLLSAPIWTQNLGLARTLIALSGLGTLAFSAVDTLIRPEAGVSAPFCSGPASISAWCLVSDEHLVWAKVVGIVVLCVAASGWRPRITAIPMWWVLFGNQASLSTVDGGDQIASVLALLLIPVSLTDRRRSHWTQSHALSDRISHPYTGVTARITLVVIQVQVAFVYLNSALSKLSVAEWVDGTAVYYWLRDPMFGPTGPLREVTDALMVLPWPVALATWGTLALEFALGISLFLPPAAKRVILPLGLAFHLSIALTMGLWSFAFAMWGALILALCPGGRVVDALVDRWRRVGAAQAANRIRPAVGGSSVTFTSKGDLSSVERDT